jgi:hypothetical protein
MQITLQITALQFRYKTQNPITWRDSNLWSSVPEADAMPLSHNARATCVSFNHFKKLHNCDLDLPNFVKKKVLWKKLPKS